MQGPGVPGVAHLLRKMAEVRNDTGTAASSSAFKKKSFPSSAKGIDRQMVNLYASQYRNALAKPASDMASLCREMFEIGQKADKPGFAGKSALLAKAIQELASLYAPGEGKSYVENMVCASLGDALAPTLMLLALANRLANDAVQSGATDTIPKRKAKMEKALAKVESIIASLRDSDSLPIVPGGLYGFILQLKPE